MLIFFLVLPSCVFAGAVFCSVNDPGACDNLSQEVAFTFSCDDSTSDACVSLMNDQFARIAPSDYPGLDGLIKAARPGYSACLGDDKTRNFEALFCPPRFLEPMKFARLPSSVEQARALNSSLTAYQTVLDSYCGLAWTVTACPDGTCPPPNATCQKEYDFTLLLRQAVRMALFFAAKREHQHLINMNASCVIQSSSECSLFVRGRLAESAQSITSSTPKHTDQALLVPARFRSLWRRPCSSDLPCPQELLDPILKSATESELNLALNMANKSLLEPVLPQELEDTFVKIISTPPAKCYSIERAAGTSAVLGECTAAALQYNLLFKGNFTSLSSSSRMTPKFRARMNGLLSSCWFDCRLLQQAQIFFAETQYDPEWNFQTVLRYAFLLCETYVCVNGVSARLASLPIRQSLTVGTYGTVNDKIYSLFGLILEKFADLFFSVAYHSDLVRLESRKSISDLRCDSLFADDFGNVHAGILGCFDAKF